MWHINVLEPLSVYKVPIVSFETQTQAMTTVPQVSLIEKQMLQ